MKVKIKKLHPDAMVPKYANPGDSGFDLVAIEDVTFLPGETKLVKTGLAINVGLGFELQVRPRSGMSLKTPLRVANAPGTVDSSFRGQVCVIITNIDFPYKDKNGNLPTQKINKGDRIAQGVIQAVEWAEFEEVNELDETVRGTGGFGSSGQ